MKKEILLSLAVSTILLISCSNENDEVDEEAIVIEAPEIYVFSRGGESTVDFSGQIIRSKMATELFTALKDNSKSSTEIINMYDHEEGSNDFIEIELNESSKYIKEKTASSIDLFSSNISAIDDIQGQFEELLNEQVANFTTWDTEASSGIAGYLVESGGSKRYVNEKGFEVNQFFAKSLIGGLVVDQILNNYLSLNILDIGTNVLDNNNDVVVTGESYTAMEHKWDEAYGYLFGNEIDSTTFTDDVIDELLNKYLKKVDGDTDFTGITQEIYDAFKLGRAAIVAKNYTVRDEQIEIIRQKISETIAIRSVYYLQQGKEKLTIDKVAAFHDLSEGLGFINSLIYTRKSAIVEGAFFSKEEVDSFLSKLIDTDEGLWLEENLLSDILDEISQNIADKFDFSVAEAKS